MTYDLNGNLLNDGTRKYEWDALNRLKKVYKDPNTTPVLIGEYTYDAQGRRIRKVVTNSGLSGTIPNATTDYIYTNWQCLEERDGSNLLFKQYVWGIYIDELLKLTTNSTINGNSAGDYYPLQDLLYRTTALTNSSGSIIETYDTDAYGNTLIFTTAGTGSDWFADDATQGDNRMCEHLFTGRRYDSENGVFHYRKRWYVPNLGKIISRDNWDYVDGLNLYAYVHHRPASATDASGTLAWPVAAISNMKNGYSECDAPVVAHWHFVVPFAATCEGYVVQHIKSQGWFMECKDGCSKSANSFDRMMGCLTGCCDPTTKEQNKTEFYEAFPKEGGKIVPIYSGNLSFHDKWGMKGAPHKQCGGIAVEASAAFYCGRITVPDDRGKPAPFGPEAPKPIFEVTVFLGTPGFKKSRFAGDPKWSPRRDDIPQAADLPASLDEPNWWQRGAAPIRKWALLFRCCNTPYDFQLSAGDSSAFLK